MAVGKGVTTAELLTLKCVGLIQDIKACPGLIHFACRWLATGMKIVTMGTTLVVAVLQFADGRMKILPQPPSPESEHVLFEAESSPKDVRAIHLISDYLFIVKFRQGITHRLYHTGQDRMHCQTQSRLRIRWERLSRVWYQMDRRLSLDR